MKTRYIQKQIVKDLKKKMVFISGPRQVGKTTLAKSILKTESSYLNWDIPAHREAILRRELPVAKLWCFDEIHKYTTWRDYLKGVYDEFHHKHEILVTGSARLDMLRKTGDSLQGRYHHLRLHPLSVKELGLKKQHDFHKFNNETFLPVIDFIPKPFIRVFFYFLAGDIFIGKLTSHERS